VLNKHAALAVWTSDLGEASSPLLARGGELNTLAWNGIGKLPRLHHVTRRFACGARTKDSQL